jgi:hypothetical protein
MVNIIEIPGVMTREMVKQYAGRKEYASAEELKKATERTNLLPICVYDYQEHGSNHLPKEEIIGWGRLRYDNGKIKTKLYFDTEKMTQEQLDIITTLRKENLSPAFRHIPVNEPGTFQGQKYDVKQTEIDWQHIAVVTKGRCDKTKGCGLYMDSFDSVEVDQEGCVAKLISEGHSEASAKSICEKADQPANDTLRIYADTAPLTSADNKVTVSSIAADDSMSEQLIQEKDAQIAALTARLDQIEADAVCELRKEVVKKLGLPVEDVKEAGRDALELMLKIDTHKLPGQNINDQQDAEDPDKEKDPDKEEEKKDADYEPGLIVTKSFDYNTMKPVRGRN